MGAGEEGVGAANLGSHDAAAAAMKELAGVGVSGKRVRRMANQIGEDRLRERRVAVEECRALLLMQRVRCVGEADPPRLGVVMMDGGRCQRRDRFGQPRAQVDTHWREAKVGVVLAMDSGVAAGDPHPEFPYWLANAAVVPELASPASGGEESAEIPAEQQEQAAARWQVNAWVKGSEKFCRRDHGDALLQLRADSLSDTSPLDRFWTRWRANQTGANRYRTTTA